jgi:undecaprenyl-diphosphatase
MLEALTSLDTKIFLAINQAHAGFLDFIMFWASNKVVWVPFYVFLIYLFFLHYKRKGWLLVVLAILLIAISDQTSVHFFKDVIQRLRPCHEPSLADLIRLPGGHCGGQYGFISSHATNSFALAVYTGYFIGKKLRYFMLFMLVWAALVSYSRIYMGVHYPLDVLAGAAWGSLLAAGMITWSRNLLGFKF